MKLRDIPISIRISFILGFSIGAVTLSAIYWMRDAWEHAPDWLYGGSFIICPAMLAFLGMPMGANDDQPLSLLGYALYVLVIAALNGFLYAAIGFVITTYWGIVRRWSQRRTV